MDYIPNNEEDRKAMLDTVNVTHPLALFGDISSSILLKDDLKISKPMSEFELKEKLNKLAEENGTEVTSFLGAGSYNHLIPSVVNHIISRSEFYTAYTPYQPEISQGTLTAIFEFQTIIANLTGMDVCNASMYDGASSLAEAMVMAVNLKRLKKVLISKTVHPEYRQVLKTYAEAFGVEIIELEIKDGVTDIGSIESQSDYSAVLIQSPNFFGLVEDIPSISDAVHTAKALSVSCVTEATSLGLLKSPGSLGADICCGELQSFGNSVSFGGPYLGFISCKTEFMRKLPGRIVGKTSDSEDKEGYILTLQAREQHIRREKATSNICSNEALCMLACLVHIVCLGKKGVRQLSELNTHKAHYLYNKIKDLGNFSTVHGNNFYNEFVIQCADSKDAIKQLRQNNFNFGVELEQFYPEMKDSILLCVTEKISKSEIDRLLEVLDGL